MPGGTGRDHGRIERAWLMGRNRPFTVALVAVAVVAATLGAVTVARSNDSSQDQDTAGTVDGQAFASTSVPGQLLVTTTEPAPVSIAAPVTTSTAPPTTVAGGPSSLRLAFTGDVLPHSPLNDAARGYGAAVGKPYDYAPMFAPMVPLISGADLALCHLEVPVHPPSEAPSSYPSFGAPPELVDGIRGAGYAGCSTASNHSLDRGRAGIAATLDRMDQVGLAHNGTARVELEGGGVATTYDVHGVRLAHLSWAYGFNGYRIPPEAPWAVNEISVDRIRAAAHAAREAGADLVVLSLHWGNEYQNRPSDYQRDVATQLLPSPDIDLIVGHHAHVVQPIEQVGGTYVAFGLGNQVSNQTQLPRRDGLAIVATAVRDGGRRWSFSGVEAVPTYVDLPSFRILPVVETLRDPTVPAALRAELEASYDRTAAVIVGPFTPGVTLAARP